MTDQATRRRSPADSGSHTSGWTIGMIAFAATIMIMAGTFQIIAGLIALFQNEFYVTTRNYIFQFDATTWGWVHLLFGLVVGFAGFALFRGRTWGRTVAIIVAGLSALLNFLFIPYYPFWALTIIALNVWAIWAIATHGGELQDTRH